MTVFDPDFNRNLAIHVVAGGATDLIGVLPYEGGSASPALDAAALDALIERLVARFAVDDARVLLSVEVIIGPPLSTDTFALAERRIQGVRQRLLDAGVDAIKVTSSVL